MPTMRHEMRILVVEDEAGIADFLRRGLVSEGYESSGLPMARTVRPLH